MTTKRHTKNDKRTTTNDQRPTTNDQRPTTNDQRPTTNDQRPTTNDHMCGIVGSFNPGGDSSRPEIVERMRDVMSHRGPDGVGCWQSSDRHCAFGHLRLAIIDLSNAANQPMLNADGSVALVFNGEIYNHQDVRRELERLGKYVWKTDHSDTEVLLHAYEEWGVECVHRFYGMFAFAVYDARDRARPTLHLVRDRVG